MRGVRFFETGVPAEVVECAAVPAPEITRPDEVLVAMMACPINPADMLTLRGVYPRSSPDSRTLGGEGVGTVLAVGAEVVDLAPGDRVLPIDGELWNERVVRPRSRVIRIAPDIDLAVAASLKANPATALLMLGFAGVGPGDWVVQNAANSSVGRSLITIAAHLGIRTANVVRREVLVPELAALGADVVLVDGDDLVERLKAATGGAPIKLAIDAVGGKATGRLAAALAPAGELLIYGAMTGEPGEVSAGSLIFNDIVVRGFWLRRYLMETPRDEIEALYARLCDMAEKGIIGARVDSRFPVTEVKAAVERAWRFEGEGKVLITFE